MSPTVKNISVIVVAVVLCAAAVIGGWWAFVYMQPAPETQTGIIKIGATVSLKGSYQHEGTQALWGILAGVRWVNEHGGVKVGDKIYNFTFTFYDDESSDTRVKELYSKLVNEGVNFLIGPYSTALCKAAVSISENAKKIMIAHGVGSDVMWQSGYKYLIGVTCVATKLMNPFVEMLASRNDSEIKIALIYKNDAFTSLVAQGAKNYSLQKGLNIVYEYRYEPTATDYSSPITEAKLAGANVLLGGGHYADGTALLAQAWDLEWKLKAACISVAPTLLEFGKTLGEAAEGVFGPANWELGAKWSPEVANETGFIWVGPSEAEYVDMFKEYTTELPEYHSAAAFTDILYLAKAIERAGSLDTDAVRNAFNDLRLMTFFGPVWIQPETGKANHETILIQWQNGTKKIVWPPEAANADPIYPATNWWQP